MIYQNIQGMMSSSGQHDTVLHKVLGEAMITFIPTSADDKQSYNVTLSTKSGERAAMGEFSEEQHLASGKKGWFQVQGIPLSKLVLLSPNSQIPCMDFFLQFISICSYRVSDALPFP